MNKSHLERLLEIGQQLIPNVDSFVGAGEVPNAAFYIDKTLKARPDLAATLEGDVEQCTDELIHRAISGEAVESSAFDRVATVIVGAYYMNPVSRQQIGYPGQLALEFDPMEYVTWVEEGLLDQVLAHGPRYREVGL